MLNLLVCLDIPKVHLRDRPLPQLSFVFWPERVASRWERSSKARVPFQSVFEERAFERLVWLFNSSPAQWKLSFHTGFFVEIPKVWKARRGSLDDKTNKHVWAHPRKALGTSEVAPTQTKDERKSTFKRHNGTAGAALQAYLYNTMSETWSFRNYRTGCRRPVRRHLASALSRRSVNDYIYWHSGYK